MKKQTNENIKSVHMQEFPKVIPLSEEESKIMDIWEKDILPLRNECMRLLTIATKNDAPKNPADAMMEIDESKWNNKMSKYDFACMLGVSRIIIGKKTQVHNIMNEPKCQRCWRREETVTKRSDGGDLCNRCADAIGLTFNHMQYAENESERIKSMQSRIGYIFSNLGKLVLFWTYTFDFKVENKNESHLVKRINGILAFMVRSIDLVFLFMILEWLW